MLEKSISSPGADLWALGVIIYEMICGQLPFKSSQEWQTFQLIINVDYKFHSSFDQVSKDLVSRLLIKEPQQRLGAGPMGSKNDYQALKNHPFFEGIDWRNLNQQNPPIKSKQQQAVQLQKHKNQSVIQSQDMMEMIDTSTNKNANQINNFHKRHQTIDAEIQFQQAKFNQPEISQQIASLQQMTKTPPIPKREAIDMLQQIQELKRGFLKKKNRFFMQQIRIFVLTSEPRLKYYKNDNDFRGEISLTSDVVAKYNGDGSFKLKTNRKVYVMREVNAGEAEDWVNAINEAVENFSLNLQ
eukprot:403377158